MAKPLVQQLQDAIEKGDKEKVALLTQKIDKALGKKKKAPRKPAKPPVPKGGPSVRETPKKAATGRVRPPRGRLALPPGVEYDPPDPDAEDRQDVDIGERDDSDWLAPTMTSLGRSRQVRGQGDVNKNYAQLESMQGIGIRNQFARMRIKDDLNEQQRAIEQSLHKQPIVARPGTRGAKRPIARKVTVRCDGCLREFQVYPSEIHTLDSESMYKCDRCIRRGR
jgi:hypothetical protein